MEEELSCSNGVSSKGVYRLEIFDWTSIEGLLLGEAVNCCQHLGGAGASCAIHGATSPNGGFVVVRAAKAIKAQSWYWTDGEGGICFDNIEALDKGRSQKKSPLILDLYKQLAAKLIEKGFKKVTVGLGYSSLGEDSLPATSALVPVDYSGYRDSKTQGLLAQKVTL